MASETVEYGITASLVVNGSAVDLLGYRTAKSWQIDDVCQNLRKELRPQYGDAVRITVHR